MLMFSVVNTLKDRDYLEMLHTGNSVWLLTVKVAHRQVVSLAQLAKACKSLGTNRRPYRFFI